MSYDNPQFLGGRSCGHPNHGGPDHDCAPFLPCGKCEWCRTPVRTDDHDNPSLATAWDEGYMAAHDVGMGEGGGRSANPYRQ